MYICILAINVQTGEIFHATFPDKGPECTLRHVRTIAGGHEVSLRYLYIYALNVYQELGFCYSPTLTHPIIIKGLPARTM